MTHLLFQKGTSQCGWELSKQESTASNYFHTFHHVQKPSQPSGFYSLGKKENLEVLEELEIHGVRVHRNRRGGEGRGGEGR